MTDSENNHLEKLLNDSDPKSSNSEKTEQIHSLIRLVVVLAAILVLGYLTHSLITIAIIAALIAMVMIHELGHFVTAKLSGMKVTEFFVGFGPRLWSVRKGETEYGVKAIPAGGYVRILGMSSIESIDPVDEPRTFRQATFPRRLLVGFAGSFMHFVMAFVLLWSLFSFIGVPNTSKVQIAALSTFDNQTSPAIRAGLQPGDLIVAADGHEITSTSQLADIISKSAGKPVSLEISRDGHTISKTVTPVNASDVIISGQPLQPPDKPASGVIGVELVAPVQELNPLAAVGTAITNMWSYSIETVTALISHFSPHGISNYVKQLQNPSTQINSPGASSRFESPVGIVRLASQAAASGIGPVLSLLFSINIFIGIFNLVPFPPLDGGHIAVAIYERLRSTKQKRYHVDIMKLMPITYVVVTLIVLLGVTALYLDIAHPLSNPFG
ncbi:MAG: M50 family metallopeptidase [Actinomycetota bacterium]|jgi:membrane-associated protease RseP (regulator of RpoE activity)|nr:M50 family metallopeptidase [Actinomycetota bacterium]